MHRALAVLLVTGCSSGEPLCSAAVGTTGRGIPLCSSATEAAVCDDEGAVARYERDAAGRLVLIDGVRATCDEANQPVCPDPLTSPRCIVQPDG
jgi:hypothetical protein